MCENCEKEVERIDYRCLGCGLPQTACLCSRNNFSLVLASPFLYKDNIRLAIHRFKFRNETELAVFFGKEVAQCVAKEFGDVKFDVVTCVPQTKRKRRKRGFNQSALLAKRVAAELSLPFNELLLFKTRETADQHDMRGKDRLKNLKNAFTAENEDAVRGKTILLCDDIKTTGATLNECRKALFRAGAAAVCCTTIAVTPEKVI
ncbi:MAG: ComF family protein [Clostridia bacterium]|nr:ComF family protein [Clostridia bacterium]